MVFIRMPAIQKHPLTFLTVIAPRDEQLQLA
jgi:hypothetical protein